MEIDADDGGGGDEGAPAWMATFSDLATLLLTFFVLLLSFAELDVVEFRELLGSVRDAFGVQFISPGAFEVKSTTPVELNHLPNSPLTPAIQDAIAIRMVEDSIEDQNLKDDVEVQINKDSIVIRIKDKVLFDTGSNQLKQEAYPILDKVLELTKVFKKGIAIEGHTDNRPIRNSRFASNWELSTGRSAAVLRYFVDKGKVEKNRLRIAGYADTKPLVPNDSADNQAKNRRVEFVFDRPNVISEKPAEKIFQTQKETMESQVEKIELAKKETQQKTELLNNGKVPTGSTSPNAPASSEQKPPSPTEINPAPSVPEKAP